MTRRVLVVDDSLMVRNVVTSVLEGEGFEVVQASDGYRALGQIRDHGPFDLMVCDVSMPRINGLELLEELQDASERPPVLFLSIEGHPKMLKRARALGASGWLLKPVQADILLAAVGKVLREAA